MTDGQTYQIEGLLYRFVVPDKLMPVSNSTLCPRCGRMAYYDARASAFICPSLSGSEAACRWSRNVPRGELAIIKSLLEENARVHAACDLFEKNSADAVAREERITRLENQNSLLGTTLLQVLIKDGVVGSATESTGPELLLAAQDDPEKCVIHEYAFSKTGPWTCMRCGFVRAATEQEGGHS